MVISVQVTLQWHYNAFCIRKKFHAFIITRLQTTKSSGRVLVPQCWAIQINTMWFKQLNINRSWALTEFSYQDISSEERVSNFSFYIDIIRHIVQEDVSQVYELNYKLQLLPIQLECRKSIWDNLSLDLGRKHHADCFTQVHCQL